MNVNFCYQPSRRYDDCWVCPLPPGGNSIDLPLRPGERLPSP